MATTPHPRSLVAQERRPPQVPLTSPTQAYRAAHTQLEQGLVRAPLWDLRQQHQTAALQGYLLRHHIRLGHTHTALTPHQASPPKVLTPLWSLSLPSSPHRLLRRPTTRLRQRQAPAVASRVLVATRRPVAPDALQSPARVEHLHPPILIRTRSRTLQLVLLAHLQNLL